VSPLGAAGLDGRAPGPPGRAVSGRGRSGGAGPRGGRHHRGLRDGPAAGGARRLRGARSRPADLAPGVSAASRGALPGGGGRGHHRGIGAGSLGGGSQGRRPRGGRGALGRPQRRAGAGLGRAGGISGFPGRPQLGAGRLPPVQGGRAAGAAGEPCLGMNPLVKDLGEFGLIEQLRRYQRARPGLVAGIGDDAAVMRGRPGWYTLFTTDMLVEGVHFLPGTDPYALGRKAMAVNVSDIAAMGGLPTFAVVALGVPPAASVHAVQRLYEGLSDEGAASGAAVVGGDTVRAPVLTISVALLGEVEEGRLLLRSGALVGDRVCVTHRLGDAAAGLILLQRP